VYVAGLNARGGLDVQLIIPSNFPRLPDDLELAVFRVAQECLTNIHRHSGSKTAAIDLSTADGGITLEVRDQGCGISPEKLVEIETHGSGVGIQGMRERLRPFNGKMRIESNSSGTAVSAMFAIPKSYAAARS
jgi:two-component system, NarL family, sensor kinase